MNRTTYALIGSGPAAFYAACAIRKRDPEGKLAMISAEGQFPYYRPLISYYLAGLVPLEKLFFKETDFYHQNDIELISGTVLEVNSREKNLAYKPTDDTIEDRNIQYLHFEKLLIASGGVPTMPDIQGIKTPGVFSLRTIGDAKRIASRAKNSRKALLMGGGLVSLKAAYALHRLGLETTLVVTSSGVLSQMLDKKGAEIMAAYLREKGLKLILQNDVIEIHGNGNGKGVTGVTLADGQELESDLVVVGKGVRPSTPFLDKSDIKRDIGGVVTDVQLQTNRPGIYAAGDVALCPDLLLAIPANNALWPNATAQGRIAGANMSGDQFSYQGSMRMNATEFFGLPVIAVGLGRVPGGADRHQEVRRASLSPDAIGYTPGTDNLLEIYEMEDPLQSKKEPHYLRLVFQKNRLLGYVAIGEYRKAGMLTNLIMGQSPLAPSHKERLINGDLAFPFSV